MVGGFIIRQLNGLIQHEKLLIQYAIQKGTTSIFDTVSLAMMKLFDK